MCIGEHCVLDHAGQKRGDLWLETRLVLSLKLQHSCDSCSDVQCEGAWTQTEIPVFLFKKKKKGWEGIEQMGTGCSKTVGRTLCVCLGSV